LEVIIIMQNSNDIKLTCMMQKCTLYFQYQEAGDIIADLWLSLNVSMVRSVHCGIRN